MTDTRVGPTDRILLEALPVAIYVTDAEGSITYYNSAAAEFWGTRPEIGTDKWCGSWRLFTLEGDPLPHDQCPMALTLKTGNPVRGVEAIAERPDGTRIRFLSFPTPLRDAAGTIIGAINLMMDVTEQRRSEADSRHLAAILSSSEDIIISKTLQGQITFWNAVAARTFGYSSEEMIGQNITRIVPPELLDEEKDVLARLQRGERLEHYETVRVARDGRRINVSLTVSPLRDKSGKIIGASKVARDITPRKAAENSQKLLLGELSHRVKNTLATVQAIATQSLRRSRNPAEFLASFTGRILSLSRAHDLLSDTRWEAVDLGTLVRDQVLLGVSDERIVFRGPALRLDPQPALHVAMILHELGTNARKYGALSVPAGHLSIDWRVEPRVKDRALRLHWEEGGGPPATAPGEFGFGTRLIKESLGAHGGKAAIEYTPTGVVCDLTLPLGDSNKRSGAYSLPAV
jgi:PAS domain S-box-containing protein